jgi:hypothetical protein
MVKFPTMYSCVYGGQSFPASFVAPHQNDPYALFDHRNMIVKVFGVSAYNSRGG